MSRFVDFSTAASKYDRRHGRFIDDEQADRLLSGMRLQPGATVIDIAAGTGRVAIPLAGRGLRVIADDRSPAMLEQLKLKDESSRVSAIRADVTALPFADNRFDAAIVAKLLYLVPPWRELIDEAVRVVCPGGVILHEWANGEPDEPWVLIREKARALFEGEGVAAPFHPGARSEEEVDSYLRGLGAEGDRIDMGGGRVTVTPGDFLRRILEGEVSYIWDVPEEVRKKCLPELENWVRARFTDLDAPTPLPRQVSWMVYRLA